jgi:hypothetical protein
MNEPPPIPPVLPHSEGTVTWHGSTVHVQSRQVPKYLWTTASIDVYLNDECVLQTGGKLNPTGSCSATFNHEGATHTVDLSWGVGIWYSFPYQLRINGIPIIASRVRANNWYMGLIVGVIFGTILGAIIFLSGLALRKVLQ